MIISSLLESLARAGATTDVLIAAAKAFDEDKALSREAARQRKIQSRERKKLLENNNHVTKKSVTNVTVTTSPPIPPYSPLIGFPDPSLNPPIIPPTPAAPDKPAWLPLQAFGDFKAHRNKIRKPMTERAEQLIITELEKLRKRGHDPTAVLEQSIRNGWQDVFEIKEKTGNYAKPPEPKKSNVITL